MKKFNDQLTLLASLIRWQIVQNALSSKLWQYTIWDRWFGPLGKELQGYKNQDGSIKLFKDLETQCNETDIPPEKGDPKSTTRYKYKWSYADMKKMKSI